MSTMCVRATVVLIALCLQLTTVQCCEVTVSQPWEDYTYIPEDSIALVKCTADIARAPVWTVFLLSNETNPVGLQFALIDSINSLNRRGFYEVPSDVDGTILLKVNVTEGINNNGTEIQCVYPGEASTISKTVLIVYEPQAVEVEAHDITLRMANISWSPNPFSSNNNYSVSVTSSSMKPHSYEVQTPSFKFIAPDYAPPCEVYNFSVTATPVGATYTGDDCSVPSPVLSRMLPSLPDKVKLESSLNCSLERRNDDGRMTMTMSIMPISHYCADYPVINYTLVMKNMLNLSETRSILLAQERNVTVNTLSENSIYAVKIVAGNDVGKVSTQYREIYTTDVQNVQVIQVNGTNAFEVLCDYIPGSNANGCMVVLIGGTPNVNNITVNLTRARDGSASTKVVYLTLPTLCYDRVFAFDIEYDGSIAAVAVPGRLITSEEPSVAVVGCTRDGDQTRTPGLPRLLLVLIGLVILIVLLITIIITVLCLCAYKMKRRLKTGEARGKSLPTLTPDSLHPQQFVYFREDSIPRYEIPGNLSPTLENTENMLEDDHSDYSKTVHFHNRLMDLDIKCDVDSEDYAQLQENFYHVLEQGGSDCRTPELTLSDLNDYDVPDLSPTLKQCSTTNEQCETPIYQEISQFSKH